MEFLDIYDENMVRIGTMEKLIAHKQGQWHNCAHIWITDGKNVFVQLRQKGMLHYPNLWDVSSAGHFVAGDTPIRAAMREFREELGIKWKFGNRKQDRILKLGKHENGDVVNEFQYIWFLKAKLDLAKLKLQPDEVADVKYVPFDEFVTLFNSKSFVPHNAEYRSIVIAGLKALLD